MKLEEKYIEQKDYYELFRNNYHFHINIIDTLDNHELTTIYSAYADKTIRMGFASRQNKENLNMMHQEHLYILNDLKNKDYENATKHVRLHTEKAKTRLIII